MLRNPDDYPEPEAFKPERFLDADGNIDPNVRDPTMIAFGFGRRCVKQQCTRCCMAERVPVDCVLGVIWH